MISGVGQFKRTRIACIAIVLISMSACGGGSGYSQIVPPEPTSPLEWFDSLWNDFDRNYSFFILKGIDWEDSRSRFRSQLSRSSTDNEFFTVLSDMLLELEDQHVRLETPLGTSKYTGWFDQYPPNFDESVVMATT